LRTPIRCEQPLPGLELLTLDWLALFAPGVGVGVAMTVVVEGAAAGGRGV
jgi:hypothetical protein